MNTKNIKAIGNCKGCGIEYDMDEVGRVYGYGSPVLLGSYHSAECYTNNMNKKQGMDDTKESEVNSHLIAINKDLYNALENITNGYFNGESLREIAKNMEHAKKVLQKANPNYNPDYAQRKD
jgi:hypothetical protein